MASITWIDNDYHDGSNASGGLEIYMGGTTLPSNATLTSVSCSQAISSSTYSTSSKNQLYYLKRSDNSTTIFSGSPIATSSMGSESGSPTSARAFHSHCTVTYTGSTANYNYLRGTNGACFYVKMQNNKSGSTSYWRAGKLVFNYYIRCGDASNVVASGGLKSLSATWTRGANGTDDTPTYEVCYSTSKSWNTNTASTNSGTSASWTITTAGTYYVGVRVTGASSGVHDPVWSGGVYVSTFIPTLVIQGQSIKASDYNQIRTVYSVTAMTANSSVIDDANIAAIRNYNTNVVATSAGTVVTASYFNDNVLNKIK